MYDKTPPCKTKKALSLIRFPWASLYTSIDTATDSKCTAHWCEVRLPVFPRMAPAWTFCRTDFLQLSGDFRQIGEGFVHRLDIHCGRSTVFKLRRRASRSLPRYHQDSKNATHLYLQQCSRPCELARLLLTTKHRSPSLPNLVLTSKP